MTLNSKEFALLLDDLRPMPLIKQIMIYSKRSESKLLPEYLELLVKINREITMLYDELFECTEKDDVNDKLSLYKRLIHILDDIKTNLLKPMKFNPLTDVIDNFNMRFYNFQEKSSPISVLYETLKDHILNERYLNESY